MIILTLKPDALALPDFDYDTIYPHMGLNESGAIIMEAPPSYINWAWGGYFGMGYYLYGSNLNINFLDAWDTSDYPSGPKTLAKEAIKTTWANRIIPWFVACAASDNTCTNAAIRIFDRQVYTLDNSGLWIREDYTNPFSSACTGYTIVAGVRSSPYTTANLYNDSINIPAFPFCPTSGDWAASSSDTSKYRYLHTTIGSRIVLSDPSLLRGALLTFKSQIVSTNGQPLNGVPKFLVQAGIDAGYNNDSPGSNALEGALYSPAMAGSRWSYANVDGSFRDHYVATFTAADSYQDLTSAYSVGGGVSVQTAAQFAANMPNRAYQATL